MSTKIDKQKRLRKTSPQPATSSTSGKATSSSTKFTIEQKVISDAVKKGPYSVKRTVDPNDLVIKRRLGEGSKPLFSNLDLRDRRSATPTKKSVQRDSSSDSSSPDDRNRYRTHSTRSQNSKRQSAEKVPYFMDQKREKDRIARVYGRSRRSRSLSYEHRKRSPASHANRYRDRGSSSRDRERYRSRYRSQYSRSRSRSRDRRRRSRRDDLMDDRVQPVTQFIPIPVPVEYPYMQPAWGAPMIPPQPRFPYMVRPTLPPPMPFMPRHFRPPRYVQNSYGRGHFRPRQY